MASRSLSEVIGIKDKILELLNEPTLNKVSDSVCTLLFVAMVINIFTERNWEFIGSVLVVVVTVGTFGYVYKRFNIRLQILEDKRKKGNIEFDHVINNPKLKETEIYLDRLEANHDEIVHLRTHVQQLINVLANKIVKVETDESVESIQTVNKAVNGDTPPEKPVQDSEEVQEVVAPIIPIIPEVPASDPSPPPDGKS